MCCHTTFFFSISISKVLEWKFRLISRSEICQAMIHKFGHLKGWADLRNCLKSRPSYFCTQAGFPRGQFKTHVWYDKPKQWGPTPYPPHPQQGSSPIQEQQDGPAAACPVIRMHQTFQSFGNNLKANELCWKTFWAIVLCWTLYNIPLLGTHKGSFIHMKVVSTETKNHLQIWSEQNPF